MARIDEHLESDLIDLGAASVETKGPPYLVGEIEGGFPESPSPTNRLAETGARIWSARHLPPEAPLMPYQLCEHISFCWANDRAVFLDLRRDRYFCLSADAEAIFRALTEADGEAAPGVERLIPIGIVEPTFTAGLSIPQACAPRASGSLTDRPSKSVAFGPLTVAEITWRLHRARMRLKRQPLKDVLTHLRRVKLARSPVQPSSGGPCEHLARQFNAVRRQTPFAASCLPDALAMLDLLAARRIYPTLILGVRLDPFAAHCWVQSGDIVLNDTLDSTIAHTPILIV